MLCNFSLSDSREWAGMMISIDNRFQTAPTGLAARAGATTAVLNWAAAPEPHAVDSYTVFRNGIAIGRTAGTNFAVAGLQEATGYVFTVAAVDAAGRVANSTPVALLTHATAIQIG
jgi:chitodextrinase